MNWNPDAMTSARRLNMVLTSGDLLNEVQSVFTEAFSGKLEEAKSVLERSEDFDVDEKEKYQSQLDELIVTSKTMKMLCTYILKLEQDGEKMAKQLTLLNSENEWLRKDLVEMGEKLLEKDCKIVYLSEKLKNMKLLQQICSPGQVSATNVTCEETKPEIHQSLTNVDSYKSQLPDLSACKIVVDEQFEPIGSESYAYSKISMLHELVDKGECDKALPLCLETLENVQKAVGRIHPDVATVLNILAILQRFRGSYEEAKNSLQEVLAIREEVFGCSHPSVATTLNNIAVLCGKLKDYKTAEELCRRALEIREKLLGFQHPDVAKQLINLALICQNQPDLEKAEKFLGRALNIYKFKLGESDRNVVHTKNLLAVVLLKMQRYEEAEVFYKEMILNAYYFGKSENARYITLNTREPPNVPYVEYGNWYKAAKVDGPSIKNILLSLSYLYRMMKKSELAAFVDEYIKRNNDQDIEKPIKLEPLLSSLNILSVRN